MRFSNAISLYLTDGIEVLILSLVIQGEYSYIIMNTTVNSMTSTSGVDLGEN